MCIRACFAVSLLSIVASDACFAQVRPVDKRAPPKTEVPGTAEINASTVGLAGGLLEGSFIRYAADIAKVLDDGDKLRVIPLVTYGAVGNVTDLLHLKGVDIAITQSDVLDHFRRDLNVPNIEGRIHYISPLYRSEVHIYARGEFKNLRDLAGRKVAFNTRGSAANLTGQVVFDRLGISVEPIFINNSIALEKMRNGEISAVVHVVGKPNELFAKFKPEPGFHFLPIEDNPQFSDYYVPTSLTSDDYPGLIPSGTEVATIAVPTVLAVFNWPANTERYQRVKRFIEAYFAKFEQLQQAPFQPKWREINAAGTVPGWTRYKAAEEVLARTAATAQRAEPSKLRADFETFLEARSPENTRRVPDSREREALFDEFIQWQRRTATSPARRATPRSAQPATSAKGIRDDGATKAQPTR
jgi:TRAP-type uncharacterized transport system substrate-binding protein